MGTYEVSESISYTIEAESEDEAREIAEGWPERDSSYQLRNLDREVVEVGR